MPSRRIPWRLHILLLSASLSVPDTWDAGHQTSEINHPNLHIGTALPVLPVLPICSLLLTASTGG